MAWQQMPGGGLWVPRPFIETAAPDTTGGGTIANTNEKVYLRFLAPKTGNIKAIGFAISTFGQCTNGLTVAMQHPSTSANGPDGTDHSTGTVSPTTTGWWTCTLGSVQAVTRGEDIGAVIRFTNWVTGNTLKIAAIDWPAVTRHYPVPAQYVTSWADKNWIQILAVQYDDDVYYPLHDAQVFPFYTVTSDVYYTGGSPDEGGIIVRFPAKVKVVGCWILGGARGGSAVAAVRLYDESSVVKATTPSIDVDNTYYSVGYLSNLTFDTEVEIPANTSYRLCIKGSVTAADLVKVTAGSAAILGAWSDTAWVRTSRTGAGAWSDATVDTCIMGLIVSQIDDGAGGAGGGPMPFRMVDSRGNRRRRGY